MALVTAQDAATYRADGVVLIRGLFSDHVDALRAGVARNMAEPGPYASTNDKAGETGLFFDLFRDDLKSGSRVLGSCGQNGSVDRDHAYGGRELFDIGYSTSSYC